VQVFGESSGMRLTVSNARGSLRRAFSKVERALAAEKKTGDKDANGFRDRIAFSKTSRMRP
jgi:hypothetical protein